MLARNGADSGVPATGASWIMIGMSIASDTRAVELVDAALADADRRAVVRRHDHHHRGARVLRGAAALGAMYVLKCVVVTITGTRPAT